MLKKVIAIGTTTQNNRFVNGQSMMFQLFVDKLRQQNIDVKIIDFGKSIVKSYTNRRISGKCSYIKLVDNFFLTIKFFSTLILNPSTPIYINTSQSKVGFIRDYIFINLSKVFRRKIIAHQFGANYGNFYNSQSESIKNRIKKTIEAVDYFIVEGDYTKKQISFLNNFEQKVIPIPNGLPQIIDSSRIRSKFISSPIKLLYLSNMIEGKGYWDVLEAANILQNKYNISVNIIFAGRFLEDIGDKICKTIKEARCLFLNRLKLYGLEDKTTYCEGLYGNQKALAFSNSHFFLLPSYYVNEGQPVSILEALAYGCVPIVTNYRLIPSMVNLDNGYFVDAMAPQQIADCVLECVYSPDIYVEKSKNAIQYFHENFTADKYIAKILKLYDDTN